ncbi:MAG: helix-turn-helix domain-containing protein [bacterium]
MSEKAVRNPVAERLREWMDQRHYSIRRAAAEIGVSYETIRKVLKGIEVQRFIERKILDAIGGDPTGIVPLRYGGDYARALLTEAGFAEPDFKSRHGVIWDFLVEYGELLRVSKAELDVLLTLRAKGGHITPKEYMRFLVDTLRNWSL